jgi:hypothetical protein
VSERIRDELQKYVDERNLFGLAGAKIHRIGSHNHLVYRAEKDGLAYAIRMINPESHRASEWISMAEECVLLEALPAGLGPVPYYLDEQFRVPFMIQEFVEATCLKELRPLSNECLIGVAVAIANLNSQNITPKKLPFLKKYPEASSRRRMFVWYRRLADAVWRTWSPSVEKWAALIFPLAFRAGRVLARYSDYFAQAEFSFHFDGAHIGNAYWRGGRAMFLDWQKVSYRNDPTFTLVRFATSAGIHKGVVSETMFNLLVDAYLSVRRVHNFREMARARLLERQISDLVWVLWEYARTGETRPVEQVTSILWRYEGVKALLPTYS